VTSGAKTGGIVELLIAIKLIAQTRIWLLSPDKLSASISSILKPLSINSVTISDAKSILVLYLSSDFNVPLGLNTFTLNGKVILE